MENLKELWQIHQDAKWPEALGSAEGELMMLDTVIVGCLSYYVEEHELDSQRVVILQDSLSDLDELLADIPDEGTEYFSRLRQLGSLLLKESPESR